MIFLTLDGDHIDINRAERIYVAPESVEGGGYRYVIIVVIGGASHRLVTTGGDFEQAEFHCRAINQCHLNKRLTREECYVS